MLIDDIFYITENASAGSTSSSSVATSSITLPKRKKKTKKYYNSDGTIKNAADVSDNVFSGQTLKRN